MSSTSRVNNSHPCPRCGRVLQQSGEASITYGDGVELKVPVFQCDNCVTKMEFLGGEAEVALTFAVDDQGKLFDPEDPDRPLHF